MNKKEIKWKRRRGTVIIKIEKRKWEGKTQEKGQAR